MRIIHKHFFKGNNRLHYSKNEKLRKPIWKKIIFKQFNQSYFKQIDSCAIGVCLSIILYDIPIVRTKIEAAK